MEEIELLKIEYLPNDLEPRVLYVSEEFGIAGHLCPCGCENKIMTPLDASEWSFKEVNNKPSLYPSVGNWQLPCKSHYWIRNGVIEWSDQWSDEEIAKGRIAEERQRKSYYEKLNKTQVEESIFRRIFDWLFNR